MSESAGEGPRPSVHQSLAYLDSLSTEATGVGHAVEGVWRHPGEVGLSRERNALWRSICLDWWCEQGAEHGFGQSVLELATRNARPVLFYDAEAASRMVPDLLPFDEAERDRLRGVDVRSGSGDEISAREPQLFGRWCQWIWEEDEAPTAPIEATGKVAEFVVVANGLSKNLGLLLDEARTDDF
jgi:hypothetical protein